ncbi:MAG: transcriptional regulator [Coriobacteriia bacterium]|nr:transcriptional regulator [Coriobacteriia bacterium]MCL2537329.1 transcriptional regulator [Coriobacteriia bacterium]
MRQLTFKGFLKKYVQDLAGVQTTNMRKLVELAAHETPRLREPLTLYAFATGRVELFSKYASEHQSFSDITSLINELSCGDLLAKVVEQNECLPDRFLRVYRSYCSVKNRLEGESHTKELIHARVQLLKQQKAVSNYRIYTSLGLNPGNANAFLKNGDTSKLSLDTARKTLALLESL